MVDPWVVNAGVLGVFSLFATNVIKIVMDYKKGGDKNGAIKNEDHDRIVDIGHRVYDLHQMHDVKDRDGVPVWYVRKGLSDAVENLAVNVDKQTNVMERLLSMIDQFPRREDGS